MEVEEGKYSVAELLDGFRRLGSSWHGVKFGYAAWSEQAHGIALLSLSIYRRLRRLWRAASQRPRPSLAPALLMGAGCLAFTDAAWSAEAITDLTQPRQYPVAQLFTFLFLMLGPFKIIGPFLKIVKGTDLTFMRRIAVRSIFLASLILLVAAFLGESVLRSYNISLPVLALSGGLILFLVALGQVLREFSPPTPQRETGAEPASVPTIDMALSPLAFPTIVTPYGIATLIVFLALSPNEQARLIIGAVVVAIMLLNLIAMLLAQHMRPWMSALLQVLGAVLSVIQVALGLRIILLSIKALGIL